MKLTNKIKPIWWVLFSLVLVLSACAPGDDFNTPTPQMENQQPDVPLESSAVAPGVEDEPTPEASPVPTNTPLEESQPAPTIRVGLQGTDPESVVLDSGELQFIEFFAYW